MPPVSSIVTLRVSTTLADEVRNLAARADESQSVVLRRLIRLGLQSERNNPKLVIGDLGRRD
jgi:Ribbon-helix-helix protein, copG family